MTANTNPLDYNGYITQIAQNAAYQTTNAAGYNQFVNYDPDPNQIIPEMLNYAELRIQREIDLLQSNLVNSSYSLSTGNNVLTMSVNDFITLRTIQYTSGTASIPLLPTSSEYIQNVYNDSSITGAPVYFAPYAGDATTTGATSQLWLIGPYPDQNYPLTILGTARMISLNTFGNSSQASGNYTFISTYLPDLLVMASMIYLSQFQRNFGRASDDPQMAVSYESQYQALLKGAQVEEARRKFQASGWTSMSPPGAATPNR